ncbi:cyclic nucleotide-binding/CBS domain-containing protein [Pseudonocardia sp. N23]|uniref:CBS domain-containing protein n=1 Tax=Pseudonocardia sp. N23 TaxID=1987376 RepID=UPI000BFC789A|nr:CBS domain-containing protein [Pseudonocardia sp. N23]GAY07375.1 CBS domain protein [Pseudonocardia sp. N23]
MPAETERVRTDDPVRRVMRAPVASVTADRSARELAEELLADEIGAVLVDGTHGPVGIVSERDVITALATGGDLDRLQAADLMSTELVWADPQDAIGDVARRMHDAGVRHVPVRGTSGTVGGMVSVREILDVFAGPAD